MGENTKKRQYPYVSDTRLVLPPNYDRVVRGLSDAELADEIDGGRGGDGYQAACRAEQTRRASNG